MLNLNLGQIFATAKLMDDLSPAIVATERTVRSTTANIGTAMQGMATTTVAAQDRATDATDKLTRSLTNINRMATEFGGGAIAKKADEMAAAVSRAGGAARLTEAEQSRVNRTVTEAIAKYEALGREAPPHLTKLAAETAKVDKASDGWVGKLGGLRTGLAALGLTAAAKAAIDFGGRLDDLSASTGINTQTLQRLNYAGVQVGVTLEQTARGVQRLQRELVEGGGPADRIRALGLDVEALIEMDPGEMFETIARKVALIENPTQRTAAAIEILGRQGGELLPLLTADIDTLNERTVAMSDQAVAGLDAAGDAWDRFKVTALSVVGEVTGQMVTALSSWQRFLAAASDIAGQRPLGTTQRQLELLNPTVEIPGVTRPGTGATGAGLPGMPTASELAKLDAEIKRQIQLAEQAAAAYAKWRAQVTGQAMQADIAQMTTFLQRLHREGLTPTVAETRKLVEQIDDWLLAGGRLTPGLRSLWLANLAVVASQVKVKTEFSALMGIMPNVAKSVDAAGDRIFAQAAKADATADRIKFLADTYALLQINAIDLDTLGGPGEDPEAWAKAWGAWATELGRVHSVFGDLIGLVPGLSQFWGSIERGMGLISTGTALGAAGGVASFLSGPIGIWGSILQNDQQRAAMRAQRRADLSQQISGLGGTPNLGLTGSLRTSVSDQLEAQLAVLQRFADGLDDLAGELDQFAGKAPAALQPMIARLLEADNLTASMREQLTRLAGDSSWEQLEDDAERYGVSLDKAGQAFQQAKLSQQADAAFVAFTRMIDGGFEMSGVLEGLADEVQDFLDRSRQFGIAVPEDLRKLIEPMVKMGLLVDANGEKLQDLSGINFAPIEGAFDRMEDLLERIAELLERGLPDAAQAAADGINSAFGTVRPPNVGSGFGGWRPDNYPEVAMAEGGIVRRPTVALIGEAGPEAVVPLSRGGAPIQTRVTVNIAGRTLLEAIAIAKAEAGVTGGL